MKITTDIENAEINEAIKKGIRHTIRFFNIRPFFTQMEPLQADSEVMTPEASWKIFEARAEPDQPPLLIYDNNGFVSPNRLEYALEQVPINETEKILAELAQADKNKRKKIEENWLKWPKSANHSPLFRPVSRLRDPSILRTFDWQTFVNDHVVQFIRKGAEAEKDPDLVLVHKSTSLDGLEQGIHPHSIQVTPGGTTKSTYYMHMGKNYSKVTPGSLLGYARSPEEIFPGLINNTRCPISLDQMESQGAPAIIRYCFNALEIGFDEVGSGSVAFTVKTQSIFNLLANITNTKDPTKSFRYLLYHLTTNPAMGRRFGWIVYGNFKKVTKKPRNEDLEQWQRCILLYKAVEEYARHRIKALIDSDEVRNWLNQPIDAYEEQAQAHLETIDDDRVIDFLVEHATGAQVRVRGAALFAAIADSMDKIALDELTAESLVEQAEDILADVVRINIESIGRIAANWVAESKSHAELVFKNLAPYMKLIVSAIELWHRQYPDVTEFYLNQIPYEPPNDEAYKTYTHLSKAGNRLSKRREKAKAVVLNELKEEFGIELVEEEGRDWLVHLQSPEPCTAITPVGTLTFPNSPFSPFSPFLRPQETPDLAKVGVKSSGEMAKSEKSEKKESEPKGKPDNPPNPDTDDGWHSLLQYLEHLGKFFRSLDDIEQQLLETFAFDKPTCQRIITRLKPLLAETPDGFLAFIYGGN
jgi:hypothetical protein